MFIPHLLMTFSKALSEILDFLVSVCLDRQISVCHRQVSVYDPDA